jgi:AcrR family transcriptional regulator
MSQAAGTRPSLREINCDARRQRILEAARTLIAAGGMQALSMRKLAAEAGLSVTTLYNLYGVRGEILHALIDDAVDRMDAILEADAPLEDPLERCRAVITLSIRHLSENEAIYRPMMVAGYEGLALEATADRRFATRAAGMQRAALEEAIAQGLLLGTLDPRQLADQVYHGYELACVQWGFGQLNAAGFRARALYGLYVTLLAIATDAVRPKFEAELRKLQRELEASSPVTNTKRSA